MIRGLAGAIAVESVAGDLNINNFANHNTTASELESAAVVERVDPGWASRLFVGRVVEVDRLIDFLAPPRGRQQGADALVVSAVSGMGGIGKTALVLHCASMAAERGWFSGGVLSVNLRGYDLASRPVHSNRVYSSILRALRVPADDIPATVDEQATAYHLHLDQLAEQGERVLLVLDNAIDVAQLRDLLPHNHAHRTLVTTRDVLDLPGGSRMILGVLSERDAVELLNKSLYTVNPRDTRPITEPVAAWRLINLCGLLPLAVKIAAAILGDEPDREIDSLCEELDDTSERLPVLEYGGPGIAAVIELSHERLSKRNKDAALLLPLLTVNPGPDLSSEAVAALAEVTLTTAAIRLRTLRSASLVQRTPSGRWQLHDLVAAHARKKLNPRENEVAISRLISYYAELTERADKRLRASEDRKIERSADYKAASDEFNAERPNLVAVAELACSSRCHQQAYSIGINLARYLSRFRHLNDWVVTAKCAVNSSSALGRFAMVASAKNNLGLALRESRNFEEAIENFEHCLILYGILNDRDGKSTVICNLGITLFDLRRFDSAIVVHQRALELCRELNDRDGEAMALHNLGLALKEVRRFDEAIIAHQQAKEIFQDLGSRRGTRAALGGLGLALREAGRTADALAALQSAVDLCQDLNDRHSEAMATDDLGATLRIAGRNEEGLSVHRRAVDLFLETEDAHGEAKALANLGVALIENGQEDEAVVALERACIISRTIGDRYNEALAFNNLGVALRKLDRADEAVAVLEQARDISQTIGDKYNEALAWTNIGYTLSESKHENERIVAFRNACSLFGKLGDRRSEGAISMDLGEALAKAGRELEACAAFEVSCDCYRALGDRCHEGESLNNIGVIFWRMRRVDEALQAFQNACACYQEIGDRHGEGRAWRVLGQALWDSNRREEAKQVLRMAVTAFEESNDRERATEAKELLQS
ncbi:tetratricopeptide repeat protein [Amycolatopsis sp. CA-128772]|uniref:tetratricopeptide repeat protein n=1 Tax=Amycolatopsis sp. CA-128772 TaxID=2073159 RepID=UPI0011B0C7E9|nr:tetratricopeptide repeat protein [Amycolatopsis sp. CA-128772]